MASVAAAIEQAAGPKHVDEGLWWDSFVSLLNELQSIPVAPQREAEAETKSPDPLLKKLKNHHVCLLNLLSIFKHPSSTSRSAINCPKIIIGEHNIDVKPELRNVALQLSSCLALDEVQMYILVSRMFEQEAIIVTEQIQPLFEMIAMQYFLERQCLLKCTRQILMLKLSVESGLLDHNAITEEVNELLNDGLEDKALAILKELFSSEQPPSLDLQYVNLWAEETLIEENLVLDILFLLYYEPYRTCIADRWKELLAILKDIVSGCSNVDKLALTEVAQKYAQHVKYQVILIIIEALDLENILFMVYDEVPFSQGSHAFSLKELQEIDNLISDITSPEAPEVGPIILAWATFICLVSMLPTTENQIILEIDHLAYIRQAYGSGAPNFILGMLQSEAFQDFEDQIAGYKSVLKTVMSAFIAAYDVANQMDDNILKFLLDIFCEIYGGQESLCLEFWDRENVLDGPIRSLLFTFRDLFPYQTLPIIRLLSSLCEGTWPAECVYDFLYRMTKITSLFQIEDFSYVNNDSQTVQAHSSLQVPGAPGLFIPAGTIGGIMKIIDQDMFLVRWETMHSGMLVILLRLMRDLSSNQEYEELVGSLGLLSRMLLFNKALILKLLELDTSSAVQTARFYGCMEKSLGVDAIKIVCTLINNLAPVSKDSKVIALCMNVLCKFFDCFPARVASEILRTIIFQSPPNTFNSDFWLIPEALVRLLSLDGTQTGGRYVFTISILDFCKNIVTKGVHTEPVIALVIYAVRYLLVNHGSWKYKLKYERWEIMSKVFQLIRVSLVSRLDKHLMQLKHILMETLLFDTTIHDIILQVLCIRAESLEELYMNRLLSPKEIEWLHQAVYSGLDLVGVVLLEVIFGDSSKDFPGPTALEQSLLNTTKTSIPFVTATMSLLGFFRNAEIQLAAARVLSNLCVIAQKTHSHSVSIASYVSNAKQRKDLNFVICHLLCGECASSNVDLFSAAVDLVTSAALYQPTFVEVMLFPQESMAGPASALINSKSTGLVDETKTCNGVDVFWRHVQRCENLMKRQPHILSQILHILRTLWQGGSEYIHILDKLHNHYMFWKCMSSCISVFSFSKMSNDETLSKAFQYQCQSSVLHIMTHDIFLHKHLVQTEKNLTKSVPSSSNNAEKVSTGNDDKSMTLKFVGASGAESFLMEWSKNSDICRTLKSYALCLYDKELLLHTKAMGRAFVVGLIGKVLGGDERGLSLSLIEQIQLTSKKIFEHPAFLELLGQYSTRGYSYGKDLHTLIINDLYYHLQGELEGRKIPHGSFEKVSEYLIKLEIDSILQTRKHLRSKDLHPLYNENHIYDTKALEAELGIEWWRQFDDKGFTVMAEKTLQFLKQANRASCLADSQLNALKSWMTLLTLSIFEKRDMTKGSIIQGAVFSETTIGSCVEDICDYLHTSMQLLGPLGDPTNYMPNFIASQAQLMLVFVRWMYSRTIARRDGMQVWPLYTRVIRTVITSLRSLMDIKPFIYDGFEVIVRYLLAVLLMSLELMNSLNKEQDASKESKMDMQNMGDAFADVSLMSLGFLPVLCCCSENNKLSNLSLAVIDALIKGFLAPNAWLPVLQKHFPTPLIICRIRQDNWRDSAPAVLNFCLSLARVRGGAEMLQSAGFFPCLSTFSHFIRNEISLNSGEREGPFSLWNKGGHLDGLWSLGLAVVTAMVKSVGENDAGVAVLDNALTFFLSEMDYIFGAVRAPDYETDTLGRKKTRNKRPQTSLLALQETEHAITFMNCLAKNQVTWLNVMQGRDSELRETIIHFLAFIAREGLHAQDTMNRRMLLQCSPLQREEIIAHEKPSLINSKNGWFAIAAKGCLTKSRRLPQSQQTASDPGTSIVPLASAKGRGQLDSIDPLCTEYSDLIALHVYKITFLILNFLCMQAQVAVKRVEEGGNVDLVRFPELPAPEILHGIQDQAIVIVTELFSSRNQERMEPQVQSLCLLLLRIMEQSLYLEVCVMRTCGVSPVSVRLDDFSKEYKALISAAQDQTFLEAPLKSLKRVIMLMYPSLS